MKSRADHIKSVGFVGNHDKAHFAAAARQAAKAITAAGRKIFCEPATAAAAKIEAGLCPDLPALARKVDLLLVFGGDGTMLKVARDIAGSPTPILGINLGNLGFLTAVSARDIARALKNVWQGKFNYESRSLIEVKGRCHGRAVNEAAMNDIVVSRGLASRLIELEVSVNGEPLTRYRCDGLILSTPTGSTAYSLAAGGAVVFPTAEVLALTPICPHTLSNRALILPISATIEVTIISPRPEVILSADGQVVSDMRTGDKIQIVRSRRTVRLVHLEGRSFCETLRLKLHWRGAAV